MTDHTPEPLSPAEKAWLRKVENLLAKCPERFGFFTVGDPCLTVFDKSLEHLFDLDQDMPLEVDKYRADLAYITFPTNVHGVCG